MNARQIKTASNTALFAEQDTITMLIGRAARRGVGFGNLADRLASVQKELERRGF